MRLFWKWRVKPALDEIKWAIQRLLRGYAYVDTYNFNTYACRKIVKVFKIYRKNLHGYPASLESPADWELILDKIQWSLEHMADSNYYYEHDIDQHDKFKEGFQLLGEYWLSLWD